MDNKLTKQLSYWEGKFGDDYTQRNSNMKLFAKRRKFFKNILKKLNVESILEIGCNNAANLVQIKKINSSLKVVGLEPNKKAVAIAKNLIPDAKIIRASVFALSIKNVYDFVFTAGVLIHIADKDLEKALSNIFNASKHYILAVEYYSPKRKTIPYRDLTDALFKRPYAKEYLDLFPTLKIIAKGKLGKGDGFDNCKFWLFEK